MAQIQKMTTDTPLAIIEDDDNEVGFSTSLMTFAAVMTFMIMIVGIVGNFLTVVALLRCPKVRNVAAAFIISLCVADLLFCAIVLPFSGLRFIQGTWTHGEFLCHLIPFIQYGNIGVSLLCIGMITINRYVMIAHHTLYRKLYKKQWIAAMIAFCWLFSYGMQIPTLCGAWGKFDYDPKLGTCSIMTDSHGRSSKTTLFITAFVIPCIIIIACYTKIFWVVHQSEMRMKEHANKQNSIPNNLRQTTTTTRASVDSTQQRISTNVPSDSSYSNDSKPEIRSQQLQQQQPKPSHVKDQREAKAKRNEWRITKMVLAIFLSFVICYLPITIAKVADKDVEYPVFHIFSYILLYLSACINPIIYVIMNKQYRKAYKTVIMCEPSKFLPFTKPNASSSVAEMERYRVEQQPQPNNCIANVGAGSTKYKLKQFIANSSNAGNTAAAAAAASAARHGDDRQNDYEKPIDEHNAHRADSSGEEGGGGVRTRADRISENPKWPISALANVHRYSNTSKQHVDKKPERNSSNIFNWKRYHSGRGRGINTGTRTTTRTTTTAAAATRSEPTEYDNHERQQQPPEEKPILWTEHQRHSR